MDIKRVAIDAVNEVIVVNVPHMEYKGLSLHDAMHEVVHKKLIELMTPGDREKTITFSIPANTITPNHYSWISAIHIPGLNLIDVLDDECSFSIADAGTEFARYEGEDYGVFNLEAYTISSQ